MIITCAPSLNLRHLDLQNILAPVSLKASLPLEARIAQSIATAWSPYRSKHRYRMRPVLLISTARGPYRSEHSYCLEPVSLNASLQSEDRIGQSIATV